MMFPAGAPADIRAAAAQAEQAGYAAAWTSETRHDPFVALALAATVTEKIQLGTAIAVAFARNPMSTAVLANDLQLLSRGRLLLGLGSQVRAHVTRRFSMPWSQPAGRMAEYIRALRAIWACWNDGTRLNFRGEFYRHHLMTPFFNPGPNEHGPPRVLLAAVGPQMTAVAGEAADGLLCHGFTTELYLRERTLSALAAGRARSGREDFEICGSPLVATGGSEEALEQARRAVREQIAFYASTPAYRPVLELHGWGGLSGQLHGLSLRGQWQQMGELISNEVLDTVAVTGEPAAIGPELHRRYGDVMTRMTLYAPYELDPAIAARIAADLRRS